MSVDTLRRLLSLAGHGWRLMPVFQRWRRGVMVTSLSDLVSASFLSLEPSDSGDGGCVLGTDICGRKNDSSVMSVRGEELLTRGTEIDIAAIAVKMERMKVDDGVVREWWQD